jgi:hypothetical protein
VLAFFCNFFRFFDLFFLRIFAVLFKILVFRLFGRVWLYGFLTFCCFIDFVDLFGEFCVCMNFLGFCDLCFDFGIGFSLI